MSGALLLPLKAWYLHYYLYHHAMGMFLLFNVAFKYAHCLMLEMNAWCCFQCILHDGKDLDMNHGPPLLFLEIPVCRRIKKIIEIIFWTSFTNHDWKQSRKCGKYLVCLNVHSLLLSFQIVFQLVPSKNDNVVRVTYWLFTWVWYLCFDFVGMHWTLLHPYVQWAIVCIFSLCYWLISMLVFSLFHAGGSSIHMHG